MNRWAIFASVAFALGAEMLTGCGDSHVPIPDAPELVDAPRGPCDSDRDCSALGLICDAATGMCGECSRDSDCASGTLCLVGTCSAPTTCTTSRDCPGLVCDAARGRCVECVAAIDCEAPLVCRGDGRCARDAALPCVVDADCPGAACDEATGVCVECATDADCRGAERCEPGSSTCVECIEDGDCVAPATCRIATHTCAPPACACTTSADCDDGLACNGAETCGGCAVGCSAGSPVSCTGGETCTEPAGTCEPPLCTTPTRYFPDGDGDGFGRNDGWVLACARPAGTAAAAGDCDDASAARSPGAIEVCDADDDDCDFTVDEGCSCSGVPPGSSRPCGLGVGVCVAGTQTCSSGTWGLCRVPLPTPELCNLLDDDCDGSVDESPDADAACGAAGATCTSGSCSGVRLAGVALAGARSYAWTTARTLYVWGGGPLAPVVVSSGAGVVAPSGGQSDFLATCGLTLDGSLSCMGPPLPGPTLGGVGPSPTAFVTIPGTAGAVDVSVNVAVGCAAYAGGAVRCWGDGSNGRLGTGSATPSATPVNVVGIDDAVAVSTAFFANCAVRRTGRVSCWGESVAGLLGNGTAGAGVIAPTPVDVVAIDDADDVAGGFGHMCARRRTTGEIWCWGENDFGILGDETAVDRSTPVRMRGIPAGSRLPRSLGGVSTCVITPSDGRVLCVGSGTAGALGDDRGTDSMTPVEVLGLTGVVELAGHDQRWCALAATGVYCWGQGALGDGVSGQSFRPVRVVGRP